MIYLDKNEKSRLMENRIMFDDIYKNQCNKNMDEMVEFVLNARDQFDIVEIHDQFIIDFFRWCGINNPDLVN